MSNIFNPSALIRQYKNPTLCKTCTHILEQCITRRNFYNDQKYGIVVTQCDNYENIEKHFKSE